MLQPCPPATNYQRQVEFCQRNPGYYARRKARKRAGAQAALAAQQAQALAGATAAQPEQLTAPAAEAQLLLFPEQ